MSDKKDSTASLGDSDETSVQHSVGEPVAEFCQRPEDGTKVPSASRRQDTGDVFPDDPARAKSISEPHELQGKVATRVRKPASESGNAESLARSSSDEQVTIGPGCNRREVADILNLWESVSEYSGRKRGDFCEE